MTRGRYHFLAGLAACALGMGAASAAPGDILLQDNFDDGAGCSTLAPTWTVSDTNLAGTGTQTSESGACSAFTRGDVVTITGPVIDLSSATGATLTAWLRQGLDAFSEDVDTGEDFVFEYLDAGSNWIPIETLFGADPNGEVTNVSLDLPLGALHANFQLRFRQTGGSGGPPANGGIGFDYWHIDDVLLIETGPLLSCHPEWVLACANGLRAGSAIGLQPMRPAPASMATRSSRPAIPCSCDTTR